MNLPHNAEAEKELLGAILNNNEYLLKVADFLKASNFFIPVHQKIYTAIQTIVDRGYSATPVVIKSYFDDDEDLKEVEGGSYGYLLNLMSSAQLINDVVALANVIYDSYIRRNVIDIANDMASEAHKAKNPNDDINHCIESAEQKLFHLAMEGNSDDNLSTIKQAVHATLLHVQKAKEGNRSVSGISTGFAELDNMTGGLQPSDLIIIAARPSMGKTSFAISMAVNIAQEFAKNSEESVAVFSLEMSAEQIATRIMSIKTKIDSGRLRIGHVQREEFEALAREVNRVSALPLYIDDTPALSIAALRTKARRLKRQKNIR